MLKLPINMNQVKNIFRDKGNILLLLLFFLFIFSRFYQLYTRAYFGWDQVNNAWAAQRILIEHKYPLLGFEAKANSGVYIGPLYYYFISIFYFFTHLDPIASPLTASVTSIFSFFVIFFVSKFIFNNKVALMAVFIYTVSVSSMYADRLQGPVNFIAPLSYLIFYALYKIINGHTKYIFLLAFFTGLAFHAHLTALFYPFIILLSLPLFPKKITTLKYIILAVPVFLLFFIPHIIYYMQSKTPAGGLHLIGYLVFYSHGLHLTRVLQLAHDAFIEFEEILYFRVLRNTVFFFFPVFIITYYFSHSKAKTFRLVYLLGLWIFIPWISFSIYSGEISNYYFYMERFMTIAVLAYISIWLWERKTVLLKCLPLVFWAYYAFVSIGVFFQPHVDNLLGEEEFVKNVIKEGKYIQFEEGNPNSYLYYIYTTVKHKNNPSLK